MWFRRSKARRRFERLVRQGVGVREGHWPVPGSTPPEGEGEPLADAIITWVREAMGEMRRPNGVDYVALALACRDASGRVQCSNTFGVVRPVAFYSGEGPEWVAAFLDDVEAVPPARRHEIVGALISVGDLVYELGVRTEARC